MTLLELTVHHRAETFYQITLHTIIILVVVGFFLFYGTIKTFIGSYKKGKKRESWKKTLVPGDRVSIKYFAQSNGTILSTEGGVFQIKLDNIIIESEEIFEPK